MFRTVQTYVAVCDVCDRHSQTVSTSKSVESIPVGEGVLTGWLIQKRISKIRKHNPFHRNHVVARMYCSQACAEGDPTCDPEVLHPSIPVARDAAIDLSFFIGKNEP